MSLGALLKRGRSTRAPLGTEATRHAIFLRMVEAAGLPKPEGEVRFHPPRRWRFDYGWRSPRMVALEIEGGVFTRGRHSRGVGMVADMEKYNQAALDSWLVLRVTPSQLCTPETIAMLKTALYRPDPSEEQ